MSSSLILKRASTSRSSGQWSDEDYDVLADGKVVGRIHEDASASTSPEVRWFWSVTEIVPAVPNLTNGHAATREEAMAKFCEAWMRASEARSYNASSRNVAHRNAFLCYASRRGRNSQMRAD
jgi:hypothetical protein